MGREDSILVFGWHFMLFWKLESFCLQTLVFSITVNTNAHDLTNAAHSTPLALTASITLSTLLSRARTFAFLVRDSLQGTFLAVG